MTYDWDLTSLYKSEEDYQKDLEAFKAMIPLFSTFKGHLGEEDKLKEYFDLNIRLELLVNRLYAYAASKADLDRRVVESVSRENELRNLLRQLGAETSYADPEILALGKEHMDAFFRKNPDYAQFDFSIRKLFDSQSHVLSYDKEKLLADYSAFGSVGSSLYSTLSVSDYKPSTATLKDGRTIIVSTANWTSLIADEKDPENRKAIFEALYKYFDEHKNTYADIYSFSLQEQLGTMKARGYASILEEHLDGNKIPKEVFLNLVEVAHEGAPILHRYYELRRKTLGLEKHRSYDRFLELAQSQTTLTYEEAQKLFFASIEKFPEDFKAKARKVSAPGMVDVLPKDGKRTGA